MDKPAVASYTTSGVITIWGGLAINEWLAITGIVLGIGTFIVNMVYKHLHYKLDKNRKISEATIVTGTETER